ncbi:MAG: HAMP domain-containing histidine kinase [Ruminococcus sp.]|nr:HAMP domain-containing histidine kinase [Ruminococcus sp.]
MAKLHIKRIEGFGALTKRWLFRSAVLTVAILLVICFVCGFFVRNYYYDTVYNKLRSYSSGIVTNYFNSYTTDAEFAAGAVDFVSEFSEKSSAEVWVIDKSGKVIVSSSGFGISYPEMPDYYEALDSKDESLFTSWEGKIESGEKIMAVTTLIKDDNSAVRGAVRYITSLDAVDSQLITVYCMIGFVFLIIALIVLISGFIFVSSIVKPIKEINETTKLIAGGNMDARIDHYLYKDEIGELCDSINNMAAEISTADRLKNDFISTVSHELRTPLTAIKGWGETILQVSDTDPALTQRGMNVIIDEATRLSGIVEELLDFSRIQNGALSLRIEKMDILAELDETVFAFKDRATREGVDLVYNAPDLPAPMDGDADRIKQVFVNILDNALKYTKQGGKINVTADVADDKIKITISDTGCGISAEDLPHVKEKFYKTNMTVHGSGIGLAVADEIVKLHKGTLDIDSVLGEGTTVTLGFDIDHVELGEEWDIEAAIAAENEKNLQEDE